MKTLLKRISALTMAAAITAINLTYDCFLMNTKGFNVSTETEKVIQVNQGNQPDITKVKIKSENSLLRFMQFGIFGKEKISVTVYAKDNMGTSIDSIRLYADGTEIENNSTPVYNAENDAYCLTWTLEKGDYKLSAQAFAGQSASSFYSIDLSKSNNDEVDEKEYQAIAINGTEEGRRVLIEDIKPVLQIQPVYIDTNGTYIDLSSVEKYTDGSFYSAKDDEKIWTNSAVDYLLTVSDDLSGIFSVSYKSSDAVEYTTVKTSANDVQNQFSYLIDKNVIGDSADAKTISAKSEDNAGNVSENINSFPVEIDKTAPTITIEKAEVISETGAFISNYTENKWVNKRIRFTVSAEDNGAGADRIEANATGGKVVLNNVTRNGNKITNVYIAEADFMGNIVFSAYDKVNNKSKEISYKARIESKQPSITNFEINQDTDIKDYGFSFDNDAEISIEAYDIEPYWSGIDYIELGFVDYQSMDAEFNYSEDSIRKSEPKYVSQDNAVQVCSFSVDAGFKGQILARAVDCAGNIGKWRNLESLVANNQELHNESSYRGIIIDESPDTDYMGNPLFSSDQKITLSVKDSHAGIKEIKWYVRTSQGIIMGSDTASSFTASNTDGWTIRKKRDIITEASKDIVISENENNIEIGLCFSDVAGFETVWEVKHISIDKTNPEIVSFSFDDESDKKIFRTKRTATIVVKERNISASDELIDIAVSNLLDKDAVPYTISQWELISSQSNRDADGENLYKMTISFGADADYKVNFNVADLTGKTAESKKAEFTIDRTPPAIKISYDNNNVSNKNYYNADRKATITITERNFKSDNVKYLLNAFKADNITKMKETDIIPNKLKWTQNPDNKDEWTSQINFNKEGKFSISISCRDEAGNIKTIDDTFYIDKTAPEVEQTFTNGDEKFATNGDIIPKVRFSDFNLGNEFQADANCKVVVNKIDMNDSSKKSFNYTSKNYTSMESGKNSVYELVYNIFSDKEKSDGIYEISILVSDLAGNIVEIKNLNLSINRNGSTFELVNNEIKEAVEKFAKNGSPIRDEIDVVIKEINVSKRVGDSVITVTHDNDKSRTLSKDDYTIEESKTGKNNNGWYETTYKITRKNFEDDGDYFITISTSDELGNQNINQQSTVKFAVDHTPPKVTISGVKDNSNLKESEVQLKITFSDKYLYSIDELKGDDMIINLNGVTYNFDNLDKLDAEVFNDDAESIVVLMNIKADGKNSMNNISASLADKADNVSDFSDSALSFRLSATFFMRHGIITFVIAVVIVIVFISCIWFIAKKVKKR